MSAPIMIPIEGMLCPDCEQQLMRDANETERYGIILAHCEECGGIFPLSKRDALE